MTDNSQLQSNPEVVGSIPTTPVEQIKRVCWNCKFRRNIPGSVHISCGKAFDSDANPLLGLYQLLYPIPVANKLVNFNLKTIPIPGGGAWPMNYNGNMVVDCEGFEARE